MKIAITGHTKGIGKCLHDSLISTGHQVIGFSRSNGYDIQNSVSRNQILDQIDHCDIFINNAWAEYAQTTILNEIIEKWKDTNKFIVNISSKSSYLDDTNPIYHIMKNNEFYRNYITDKKQQNDIVRSRILSSQPKIMNLVLGSIDTEMTKNLISPKMDPASVTDFIISLINLRDTILVQDITIDHPNLDYDKIKLS